MDIELEQLDQAAVAVMARIVAYLQEERGVHIETAIAVAGSLAGVSLLRGTGLPFGHSEPGEVQSFFAEAVDEGGTALVGFISSACPLLGLDASFDTTEIPPEHQPQENMIDGVLRWVQDLETSCNGILDEAKIGPELRPHVYAFTALRFVKAGEQILAPAVGKALAVSAVVAGSKTAPYRSS